MGAAREACIVFDQVSTPFREEAVFRLVCFISNWRPFPFLSLLIVLSRVLSLCCNHGLQFGTWYSFFLVNLGKGDYQSWARRFSLTEIRHHDQGHLRKREFNLVYGSRGKEAWQQVEGTAIIPGSCKLMSWPPKQSREIKLQVRWDSELSKSSPTPPTNDTLPSIRLYLVEHRKHGHQLRTRCSNLSSWWVFLIKQVKEPLCFAIKLRAFV